MSRNQITTPKATGSQNAGDTRQPIWDRINECLTRKTIGRGYKLTSDAWAVGVVTGPGGLPLERLRKFSKSGRFGDVLRLCSELGQWWLDQPENAQHLMRGDTARIMQECLQLATSGGQAHEDVDYIGVTVAAIEKDQLETGADGVTNSYRAHAATNAARETELSFKATKGEFQLMSKIAGRASSMARSHGGSYDFMTANMDINACHSNGCPLKLKELLEADDFTFAHDVFGIREHINRETGQLEHCFVPRLSL